MKCPDWQVTSILAPTRYDEHAFSQAFFGTLHETGHALYDQGLPVEHWGTPLTR